MNSLKNILVWVDDKPELQAMYKSDMAAMVAEIKGGIRLWSFANLTEIF